MPQKTISNLIQKCSIDPAGRASGLPYSIRLTGDRGRVPVEDGENALLLPRPISCPGQVHPPSVRRSRGPAAPHRQAGQGIVLEAIHCQGETNPHLAKSFPEVPLGCHAGLAAC